ncbi:MAG: NAD-dependent epimerase/dehydratase family protein [Adhaeribacter sp.]
MIFITGGSGLIGRFLIRHFLEKGMSLKVLYRQAIPEHLAQEPGIEWVKGDIADSFLLQEVIGQVDQVYHCAGLVSYAPQDAALLKEVNITGTINVVDACLQYPQVKLCHVSSIAAIGTGKPGAVLTEDAKWDPAAPHSLYGSSKYLGELEVWRGIAEGLQACIVNPSVVLAPSHDWSRSSAQLFKYVADENRFYTRGQGNFVDVRDVVTCMTTLLEDPASWGQRYILNAGPMSYRDFFAQVAARLGKKAPSVQVPDALTALVWRAEYLRALLTGKRPLITKETASMAKRSQVYSSGKVKQRVPAVFRPLEETIAWCCQELKKGQGQLQ